MSRTSVRNAWKRLLSAVLPYRPMEGGRTHLDAEYAGGVWDYLSGIEELARFSVVAGYCQHLRRGGAILEVGCGEGLLQQRLCPATYSRYVGIDISAVAIACASEHAVANATFLQADARVYSPDETFDLIVFNECLEYFEDPLALVGRYVPMLAAEGLFIVSMFTGVDTVRTKRIWKMLERVYPVHDATRVMNKTGLSWIIKVLLPPAVRVDASSPANPSR